jgi:uncharacterized paraquat-inducible protein A
MIAVIGPWAMLDVCLMAAVVVLTIPALASFGPKLICENRAGRRRREHG